MIDDALNQLWEEMKPNSPRLDMTTRQRSLRTNLTRSRDALRTSFGLYRDWDATLTQNRAVRQNTKLTIPVLGIGGVNSWGDRVGHEMRQTATDVTTVVLPGGHWVAEQAPTELLAALNEILEPYRAASPKG